MIKEILTYEKITEGEFDEAIQAKYESMKSHNKAIIENKLCQMKKEEKKCPLKDDTF